METVPPGISRRTFLVTGAAAGGGLLLGFYVPARIEAKAQPSSEEIFRPNAFVCVRPNDIITLIMPQVEMGQGTYTSMPMLIAEELEVDLGRVSLEAAPPDDKLYANPLLGFQVTGGSTSVMGMSEPLRRAGAAARVMLIAAAAAQWNVDPASCRAMKSEVVHSPTGRRLTYGALVDAAAKLPVPDKVTLKDAKDFTLIGTPAKRLDTPAKPRIRPVRTALEKQRDDLLAFAGVLDERLAGIAQDCDAPLYLVCLLSGPAKVSKNS
jgi:isoquinoline 1-oxidoreductase beta subunit